MSNATATHKVAATGVDLIAAFERVTGTTFTPAAPVTDAKFEADDARVQQHLSHLDDYRFPCSL